MPTISVSDSASAKVRAFKRVIETVIGEEIREEACVELILDQGVDSMLRQVLPVDAPTLLSSFLQLGSEYPDQVYGYVAQTLSRGEEVHREQMEKTKQQWGFYVSPNRQVQGAGK